MKVEQLIIVGGGINISSGIGEFFTNNLVIPARVASPWQSPISVNYPNPLNILSLATLQ